MNNKSLVNLKFAWEVPGLGTFRIDTSAILRPEILKPLGWHSYSRIMVRRLIEEVRTVPYDHAEIVGEIYHYFNNRHYPEKGWHI